MSFIEPDESLDLLGRLKAGDQVAYEKIYKLFSKELLSAAFKKTGNRVVAEELVQNIFISLWERHSRLEVKDLRHYLFGSLKLGIINHIRSEVIANRYIEYQQINYSEVQDDALHQMELQQLNKVIEESLHTLPQKTQDIFRLSRFEHHSTKEISAELNISEKAVEYHITRSIKRIKAYVKNFYIFFLL